MKVASYKRASLFFSLKVLLVSVLIGCAGVLSAETYFDAFDKDPRQNGWLLMGDRSSISWNEEGWLDLNQSSQTTRMVRRIDTPLDKSSNFFFEVDVMAVDDANDSGVYAGAMAPMGNEFKDFMGSASEDNAHPAVVCRAGIDVLKGALSKLRKPYVVRVACAYKVENNNGKLQVKVLDLLNNCEEVSYSELKVAPDEINFPALTVYGIGNKIAQSTSQSLRYDNLYFSTSTPNLKPIMPSFINKDLVKIASVMPVTTMKSVKISLNISSLVNVGDVEVKGSILELHKLRGDEMWTGDMGKITLKKDGTNSFEYTIEKLEPKTWSPASPTLYELSINLMRKGQLLTSETIRFGFREIDTRDGKFYLNGKPTLLRGSSLNPPAPNVLTQIGQKPAFIRDYIRDLKLRNVNIIRMESENYDDLKNWLNACDELGMMVFQGCYGLPPGGSEKTPPKDLNAAFEAYKTKYFTNFIKHPSVTIYILANQVGGTGADKKNYSAWFARITKKLKKWNPNVVYLANAGGGEGAGDFDDYHFYDGWYQGSFLGFLDWRKASVATVPMQDVNPITFSECVGAFTNDKTGFPVRYKETAASLCWGGNELNDAKIASNYQAFLMKQAIEIFRRNRAQNPRLGGIMPYTSLYSNWTRVRIFSDMKPKNAADQMRSAYQPVLVSWENWMPNVYAGGEYKTIVHVINDSDSGDDLINAVLSWELTDYYGNIVQQGNINLPTIRYYSSQTFPVSFKVPQKVDSGLYRLSGTVKQSGRQICANDVRLFIGNDAFVRKGQSDNNAVRLYDPSGKWREGLTRLGVKFAEIQSFSGLREGNVLVLGDDIDCSAISSAKEDIMAFVKGGGKILCLTPTDDLIKFLDADKYLKLIKMEPKSGVFINRAREESLLFDGLPLDSGLSYWNDYTNWDESKPGYPQVAPVIRSLRLNNPNVLVDVAVLANFGRGLMDVALAQIFVEKGSIIISCFDFQPRIGTDPLAGRLLMNIISYDSSKKKHNRYPVVGKTIPWGNCKLEKGVASAPETGLLLASEPSKKNMEGPNGPEYLVKGRRIAGPFMYTSNNEVFFLNSDDVGAAQFFATIPTDVANMISSIRNPTDSMQTVSIKINEIPSGTFNISPGKSVNCRTQLPFNAEEIRVIFRGCRELILHETRFE